MDVQHERRRLDLIHQGLDLDRSERRRWAEAVCDSTSFEPDELLRWIDEIEGTSTDDAVAGRRSSEPDGPSSLADLIGRELPEKNPPRASDPDRTEAATSATVASTMLHIERFELLEVLGEGGMGTVFLAEQQQPVHRKVALKVLRTALLDPDAAARFHAERQALARLKHKNIAAFYEAGTTQDGRPWFAMEWIEGETVTAFCDRHRLTLDERLRLLVSICDGAQHANDRQVLHRDLKPSNILITEENGEAVPKIIDFGIAQSLEPNADRLTRSGLIGTPEYLSPEAITGNGLELDARSEVYALGLLAYELLAGVHPFAEERQSVGALLRQIERGDPRRPSAALDALDAQQLASLAGRRGLDRRDLVHRIRGEIDWVVAKAIAREPSERYRSVADLGSDLERVLRHEAVEAAPPDTWYRLRKLIRRHQAAALAGLLLVLSLTAGIIGTSLGLLRAREQATSTRQALAQSESLVEFLNDLFSEADPRRRQGDDLTAIEMLQQGAARLEERFPDQPVTRARLMRTFGDLHSRLGRFDEAEPLLRQAVELLSEPMPPSSAGPELDRIRRMELAEATHSLAILTFRRGDWQAAVDLYGVAIERLIRLDETEPVELARAQHNLGVALYRLERFDQAEARYREALALRTRELEPTHPDLATSYSALGVLAMEGRQDLPTAKPFLEQALQIREAGLGADHPYVATSLNNLCILNRRLGEFEAAETACRRSYELQLRTYGDSHSATSLALRTLGGLHLDRGQFEEAERSLVEAVTIEKRATGKGGPNYPSRLLPLADLYWLAGRYKESRATAEEALALRSEIYGRDHWRLAGSLRVLGLSAWKSGDFDRAERLLNEARGLYVQRYPNGHTSIARTDLGLVGVARDRALDSKEALETLREPFARVRREFAESLPPGNVLHRVAEEEELVLLRALESL